MRLIDADKLEAELRKTKFLDENDKVIVCAVIENAPREGYSIIKKKPMPKLKPCPRCGASGRKIEEWTCRTGYLYICSECNHQSNPARSERKARENWNEIG